VRLTQEAIDKMLAADKNITIFEDHGEDLESQADARPYRLIGTVIPAIGRNNNEFRTHHLYKYVEHVCVPHVHEEDCIEGCKTVCDASDSAVEEPRDSGIFVCPKAPDLLPMCPYGWNRCDGMAFSILRGNRGQRECKLCAKNVAAGKEPAKPMKHYTQYI
jgi:hypothetical protein